MTIASFKFWVILITTTVYLHSVCASSIIRRSDGPDLFTKSLGGNHCNKSMGAECQALNCSLCVCDQSTPTFLAQRGKCVSDDDVRNVFNGTGVQWIVGSSCPTPEVLVINSSVSGHKKLSFCRTAKNGDEVRYYGNTECDVKSVEYLDENRVRPQKSEGGLINGFKIRFANREGPLSPWFEWNLIETPRLVGAILVINFNCTKRGKEKSVQLLLKTSGERHWNASSTVTPTTNVGADQQTSPGRTPTVVATQTSSAPMTKDDVFGGEKGNLSDGKKANIVTITLSVVGVLLVVASICLFIILHKRRKSQSENQRKADGTTGNDAINPTYDKGVDRIMLSGNVNAAYVVADDTYLPIIQNGRVINKQPTYETLQRHKQSNPGDDPSIYQALETDECPKENHYQSLNSGKKEMDQDSKYQNKNQDQDVVHNERIYAVLEDPCEGTGEGEGPIYQVLEEDGQNRPAQESNASDGPIYDVLESE